MITWILISDGHQARLFSAEDRERDWTLLGEFERDAPDLPPRDATDFAQQTILRLERALEHGELNAVVLVAPPSFLKMLRANLTGKLAWHLRAIVAEDLTALKEEELRHRLLDAVFPGGTG